MGKPTCVYCGDPAASEERFEYAPLCRTCKTAERRGGFMGIGSSLDRRGLIPKRLTDRYAVETKA